jgi:hypothetical protein
MKKYTIELDEAEHTRLYAALGYLMQQLDPQPNTHVKILWTYEDLLRLRVKLNHAQRPKR